MKNTLILSEAIYKGKHKLVNQGAFYNVSDIMSDVFKCFGLPCCVDPSDYFIRKAYLKRSRKKPGANWMSLDKIILEIYNCNKGTTYCPGNLAEQWWITTDVIRPRKTIETISFTALLLKVMDCCNLIRNLVTQDNNCLITNQGQYIIV